MTAQFAQFQKTLKISGKISDPDGSKEWGDAMHLKKKKTFLALGLHIWIFLCASPVLQSYGAWPFDWKSAQTQEAGSKKLRHWSVGDTVVREIDGKSYSFRCIDQNYADHMDYHRSGALFLCDEVIPANTGSRYVFETPEDQHHDYVFYPGPIVSFGGSADYKYSAVRRWLQQSEDAFADAETINTGVKRAYSGSTGAELWEFFPGDELAAQYLGYQKMEDRLFLLSVDEAYRYRDWLWRFGASKKRNPESQISEFCKGYWLRTPCQTAEGNQVYMVDLVQGNIRPEAVQRETGSTGDVRDEEVRVTGTTGVRPAFVLPQI